MAAPSVIHDIFPVSAAATDAFIRDGMSPIELRKLAELTATFRPARVLEIGMANGTSSVVIADELRKYGGHLTSIDPHQKLPTPMGYASAGVQAVQALLPNHRLIEEYDFLALPRLAEADETFDCILVDGFHSFDLTLLDLFYADKLLTVGGLLVCHDSSSPAVYKALRWMETNKPYTRLSPMLYTAAWPATQKIAYRLFHAAERKRLQAEWHMLATYQKQEDRPMPEHALREF
jgi:predicted O-methyltransferase YrrM